MSGSDSASDTSEQLVEHFFRHESANLIAVLSRVFGIARIELIEDMVQAAMLEAMNAWKHKGAPENPAAWIHRVARNRILDSLRREKTFQKALAFAGNGTLGAAAPDHADALVDQWLQPEQLSDSLLRMMFVCCDPAIDRSSQLAITLKILCGFSVKEIARCLLCKPDTIKKRLQRAKQKMAVGATTLEYPAGDELAARLSAVHHVLYLMFNEGYSTSQGIDPVREDLCEEAARLCHLLTETALGNQETHALLALMLFHAARLPSRVDAAGSVVLLEDQDRRLWDRKLFGVGKWHLTKSKDDSGRVTRYHLEAAIAMKHCEAQDFAATDWESIVKFYDRLILLADSPIFRLNRSIAVGQLGDSRAAMAELVRLESSPELADYSLLYCAQGKIAASAGRTSEAIDHYLRALSHASAQHEKTLIEGRLKVLRGSLGS